MLSPPSKASQTDGLAFHGGHISLRRNEKSWQKPAFQEYENSDQRKPAM
jgi:hypothetical protein